MRSRVLKLTALLILLTATAIQGQSTPAPTFTDATALLDAVAKLYAADHPSFHFESVSERVRNDELERSWEKSLHTAIKSPGNRFRIESRSSMGTYLQESDGTTEWQYFREGNTYVKHPAGIGPTFAEMHGFGTGELMQAWNTAVFLEAEAEHAKGPTLLPDETVVLDGRSYPCYAVRFIAQGSGYHVETTFWVEKKTLLIRKKLAREDTHLMLGPGTELPVHYDTTTTYPVAELDPPGAAKTDAALFRFTPPAEAKEVATLEPTFAPPPPSPQLVGMLLPDLTLPGPDGSPVKLSSFRGQPLVIDEWATWCGSCVTWMPALGRLERELRPKGIRVISIDRDETAAAATHYMSVHDFAWPNYHDVDGKLASALGEKRIPLTLLVDKDGRIAFAGTGSDEAALRKAIAALADSSADRANASSGSMANKR